MPDPQFDNSYLPGGENYSGAGGGFNFGRMMQGAGIGDLLGAGLLGYGMSQYQNPASAGMPYLNQAAQQLPQYFQPYMDAGQKALGQYAQNSSQMTSQLPQLQQQYSNLMSNPTGVMNAIGSTFQSSPGYGWQVGQAQNAANHAAAAGGMLGSPAEQQSVAGTVGQMANQDYYNYLNHGMSMYGQGLNGAANMIGMGQQGLGDIAHMGYGASSQLGEDLSNILMSQGNLAYAGQANQNQSQQGSLGGMGSMLGDAAMAFML